jgi:hypothetical protein
MVAELVMPHLPAADWVVTLLGIQEHVLQASFMVLSLNNEATWAVMSIIQIGEYKNMSS